jgi:hypothetical protein
MKRLNPATGKPFKRLDVREDGYLFYSYTPSKLRKSGYYAETWLNPLSIEKQKESVRVASKKAALRKRAYRYDYLSKLKCQKGCADCGYNLHAVALDFDHREDEEKLFTIACAMLNNWDQILAEVDKCDVVCANCHRVRTQMRRGASKYSLVT